MAEARTGGLDGLYLQAYLRVAQHCRTHSFGDLNDALVGHYGHLSV